MTEWLDDTLPDGTIINSFLLDGNDRLIGRVWPEQQENTLRIRVVGKGVILWVGYKVAENAESCGTYRTCAAAKRAVEEANGGSLEIAKRVFISERDPKVITAVNLICESVRQFKRDIKQYGIHASYYGRRENDRPGMFADLEYLIGVAADVIDPETYEVN